MRLELEEIAVLRHASAGLSVKATAETMGTTQVAVKQWRRSAVSKLGVTNITAAVATAIRQNLIDGDA